MATDMVKYCAKAAERSFNIRTDNSFKMEEIGVKLRLLYKASFVKTPWGRLDDNYKELPGTVEYEIHRHGIPYNKGKIPWGSERAFVDDLVLIVDNGSGVPKTLEKALKRFEDFVVYAKRTGSAEYLGNFFTKKEIPEGYEKVWFDKVPY